MRTAQAEDHLLRFYSLEESGRGQELQTAERLLRAIPRVFVAGDSLLFSGLLEFPLDWTYFENELKKRALALIFFGLARKDEQIYAAVPARLRDWLRLNYYMALEESAHRDIALREILLSFSRSEVPLIVLRGAALASLDYPDPALRTSSDIDIVVRKQDLPQAHRVCRSMNLEMKTGHGEIVYCRQAPSRVHLDLHGEFWYANGEEIWKRAQKTEIGGFPCFILSPEDNVLHLIAHAMIHHARFSLQDAIDLALVIRHNVNLDWGRIASQIKGTAIRDCAWLALSQARSWTGVGIPQNILDRCKPKLFFPLRNGLLRTWIKFYNRPDAGHFLRPLACSGGSSKIAFLLRFFFPDPEFIKRRYNTQAAGRVFIYYLLRPFLLLQKMVRYWKS